MKNDIYTVDTFDYSIIGKAGIQKRRVGNPGTRKTKRKYRDLFCAFDIETTNIPDIKQAFMYIWQFQIEDHTVIGRTWDEFLLFLTRMQKELNDSYMMIYVHNLSFEFQFLTGIYPFDASEVFATDFRKVLKCEMFDCFEFRCSYYLTNMGLSEFTKKMGVPVKLSGDKFDYSKIRFSDTELSDYELEYCITDVRSLVAALKVHFALDQDNFYSVPLTSTGYVRRDVRAAMRHYNKHDLQMQLPDYYIFGMLREAFRGGNTHANRYYTGMIIDNVSSYDRVSSYPDVQINNLFPMGKWIIETDIDYTKALRKIYKQHRACLMRCSIDNIRMHDPMAGCPYLSKSKCRSIINGIYDNGRILAADYLEVTLTDIDFDILIHQYDFDTIAFTDFVHTRYGKLPLQLRNCVLNYFHTKTNLKGVAGQELYYMKAKNKLNSIYGMSVQSPVKQSISYIAGSFRLQHESEIELLEKNNKRAFQSYAWGVWTTAHARRELQTVIDMCGNAFVYCDTDSVKFIDDGRVNLTTYNNKRKLVSRSNNACCADPSGKMQYLGIYENEGMYDQFCTLGAKKYCYTKDGKLYITIAGVAKKKGAEEMKKAGGIRMFKEGFTFREAGGTASTYNDNVDFYTQVRDHNVHITSNIFIEESEYTLGITDEYKRILKNPAIWLNLGLTDNV